MGPVRDKPLIIGALSRQLIHYPRKMSLSVRCSARSERIAGVALSNTGVSLISGYLKHDDIIVLILLMGAFS